MTKVQVNKSLPSNGTVKEIVFLDDTVNLPIIGQSNMLYTIKSDSTNGGKQTLYLWNGIEYTPFSTGSSGGGSQSYQQMTKLGVTASTSAPRQYSISIPYTGDFLRAPLEILKFLAGQQNLVKTEISFDNSDSTDFNVSEKVLFDGAMKLKINYEYQMQVDTDDISFFEVNVAKTDFKKITDLIVAS